MQSEQKQRSLVHSFNAQVDYYEIILKLIKTTSIKGYMQTWESAAPKIAENNSTSSLKNAEGRD